MKTLTADERRSTQIKERPILMCAEMVRATLEGRKTQTRRIANARGADRVLFVENGQLVPGRVGDQPFRGWVAQVDKLNGLHLPLICPHGAVGDRLWVKETFGVVNSLDDVKPSELPRDIPIIYRASSVHPNDPSTLWRPSIFMPRWASRLTLEITNVRVERVQEISEEDAKAEGVEAVACTPVGRGPGATGWMLCRPAYQTLWDSLNKARGYGWDANPWVWVIEFKPLESPKS